MENWSGPSYYNWFILITHCHVVYSGFLLKSDSVKPQAVSQISYDDKGN